MPTIHGEFVITISNIRHLTPFQINKDLLGCLSVVYNRQGCKLTYMSPLSLSFTFDLCQ